MEAFKIRISNLFEKFILCDFAILKFKSNIEQVIFVLDSAKKISPEVITKFIQDYILSAQLICETHYELSYVLPDKGKERKGMLRQLFENLERNKVKLQCKSFGLQDTTLEEVSRGNA